MAEFELTCEKVETMIFELDDQNANLSGRTRELIESHIASCSGCRQLRAEELMLTNLLTGRSMATNAARMTEAPQMEKPKLRGDAQVSGINLRWPLHRILPMAVAATAALAIFGSWYFLSGSTGGNRFDEPIANSAVSRPIGTIVRQPILNTVSFNSTANSLEPTNHIELPLGSTATIELENAGALSVTGPAIFELDQSEEGWKLSILDGWVSLNVDGPLHIVVATRKGSTALRQGSTWIASSTSAPTRVRVPQQEKENSSDEFDGSAEELYERGMSVFSGSATPEIDMLKAAKYLRLTIAHPDAKPAQIESAKFYRICALSNAGLKEQAGKEGRQWLEEYDDVTGDMQQNEIIDFVVASSDWHLGNKDEARKRMSALIERNPNTVYADTIHQHLGTTPDPELSDGNERATGQPELRPPYVSEQISREHNEIRGGYLVVTIGLREDNPDHLLFKEVAETASEFHDGRVISVASESLDKDSAMALREEIIKLSPDNVLFVVPPQLLDVNLHRQIFKIAPTLDNDLFADFSWGYLTARDGEAVNKFWQRIEALHKNGLSNKTWLETAVVGGGMESIVRDSGDTIPQVARVAGYQGQQIYFGIAETDPGVMEFVDENLSLMENASVIAMVGNGDPQGIWLFDDSRNADPDQHWEYDAERVGQDPEGKLVRIKADRFRALNLDSPVIWSGTCHSGASCRVYVESDIVSTFGSSDRTELYELPPDESLCLAMIDAGAASLLVPIASNHGMSVSMEVDFMFQNGATLGETIKATYDDVFFQSSGVPKLQIVTQGDRSRFDNEPIMQGAGANRILIGDPALRLFEKTDLPHEKSSVNVGTNRVSVEVQWQKAFHARGWNIYADGSGAHRRMVTRIECTEFAEIVEADDLEVEAKIESADGDLVECNCRAEVEIAGERMYLVLQADAQEDDLMYEEHTAVFDVSW